MSGESRVVLITGASGGLGTAVVEAFLATGADDVFAVAHSRGGAARERLHPVEADLTSNEGAHTAVAAALALRGHIDVLVHAMGGFRGGSPVAQTTDADWNTMLSMNLSAAFYVCRAVLPHMLDRKRGRIIAVGSRAGLQPGAGAGAYNVSKAGLNALVQTIAAEVKDSGVTANVVLPSVIDTAANRKADPAGDHSKWVQPAAIADVIVWLASDGAADVSGALIPVYGRA